MMGHKSYQCPRPRRPPNECFKCFAVGHQYRDCPQRRVVSEIGGVGPNDFAVDRSQTEDK